MATVLVMATLDTKGHEAAFVRDRIIELGHQALIVDTGLADPVEVTPEVSADEVAAAGGADRRALWEAHDRGAAVTAMGRGAEAVTRRLHQEGRIDGAIALGGTGGTSIAARAFQALPIGFPKLLVSTAVAGDTTAIVGASDLLMAPSVVDIAGVNRVSGPILANAAAAIAGMAGRPPLAQSDSRPLVGLSMFGVTTQGVTRLRTALEDEAFDTLTFHMTGAGGRSLEALIASGAFRGVLDITTTELCDELVGGVFSAGSSRLTGAAAAGVPQVVSVGALDMVNFGPMDTVPEKFRGRNLYVHNPNVTLMRTTPDECRELGSRLAQRVRPAGERAVVVLPLGGVSAIATPGGPFHDPQADDALFGAIRDGLAGSAVDVVEVSDDVNGAAFCQAVLDRFHALLARVPAAGE